MTGVISHTRPRRRPILERLGLRADLPDRLAPRDAGAGDLIDELAGVVAVEESSLMFERFGW